MGSYTPVKTLVPNGLDEVGLSLGMQRLPSESLSSYRRRLVLETRQRTGGTEPSFIAATGRQVGVFDVPLFEIDLELDGFGVPLAADPYVEITSTYIRAYDDYANDSLDFELNLVDRTDAYFCREVFDAFDTSTYFSITALASGYTYWRSDHLRYDTTLRTVEVQVSPKSRLIKLDHAYVTAFYATAFNIFQTEVGSKAAIAEEGDYFIDYDTGVVWTYEPSSGFFTYSYRDFPYTMFWQPVRTHPLNDADIDYEYKDAIIGDSTGTNSYENLNSEGASVFNKLLAVHPLGWGK